MFSAVGQCSSQGGRLCLPGPGPGPGHSQVQDKEEVGGGCHEDQGGCELWTRMSTLSTTGRQAN